MVENQEKSIASQSVDANETDEFVEIIELSDLEPDVKEYINEEFELTDLEGGTEKFEDEVVDLEAISTSTSSDNESILELTEEFRAHDPEIETTASDDVYEEELSLDEVEDESLSIEDDAFFDLIEESDDETFGELEDLEDFDDLDALDETDDEDLLIDFPDSAADMSYDPDKENSFEDKADFELTDEFDLTEEAQLSEFELDIPEGIDSDLEIDEDVDAILQDDDFSFDDQDDEQADHAIVEKDSGTGIGGFNETIPETDDEEFDVSDILDENDMLDAKEAVGTSEEEEFSLDEIFESDEIESGQTAADADQQEEEAADSIENELLKKLNDYFDVEDEDEEISLSELVESEPDTVAPAEQGIFEPGPDGADGPKVSEVSDNIRQEDVDHAESVPVMPLQPAAMQVTEDTAAGDKDSVSAVSRDELESLIEKILEEKLEGLLNKLLTEAVAQKVSDEIDAFKGIVVNSIRNRQ